MCGIIGYKGSRNANEIVIKGIKKLEYRGYDSWGFAYKDSKIKFHKQVGRIGDFSTRNLKEKSNIAIAHTRWATHGAVTAKNAHPHLSNNKEIAVAHNGIVENYQELREFLKKKGFKFISETDTEIIPNLIQYFMKKGSKPKDAVRKALNKLEGSFAIVAIFKNSSQIIGARRGSPLILGMGNKEFFIASDIPAFLDYTKNVVYLNDDEYVVVDKKAEIFSLVSNKKIKRKISKIKWTAEQAKKGPYRHFMLKEINEQKYTIKEAIEQEPKLIEEVTKAINNAYGVFFVGCGTSYHACVSASYFFSKVCKKHINVVLASEFRQYEHFLTPKTLMIAVSQSGETADLLDAVKFAQKHKVKTIAITNVMGSTLMRLCDKAIMMNSGPEICVLSTKSYTAQLAILLLLAYSCAGKLQQGKRLIIEASKKVPRLIDHNLGKLKKLAFKLKNKKDIFLIGRALAYPSALEGSLKIKEVSYIHAEAFAGGELKHGTIALIEKGVPVIVLTTKDTETLTINNAAEIRSRGGYIIGINAEKNPVYDYFIEVPSLEDADPILMIIPIQILAYYLAVTRKLDPDKPRNLAKSVTVK